MYSCKDDLVQYYLMDCIIQVFPDEYHLQTLETLLAACPQLQSSVDIKTVLSWLMERLSNYAASSPEVLPEFLQVEAFAKVNNAIGKNMFQRKKFMEHNANAVAAGRVLGVDLIEQITKRYIRIVKNPEDAKVIACVLCRLMFFNLLYAKVISLENLDLVYAQ